MKKLLFSTENYALLKQKMLTSSSFEDGQLELKKFPDGERYMRLLSEVSERHVVILGGTVTDADTLEIYDCNLYDYQQEEETKDEENKIEDFSIF